MVLKLICFIRVILIISYSSNTSSYQLNMPTQFSAIFSYFLVGILWGTTNPFIKHAQDLLKKTTESFKNTLPITHSSKDINNSSSSKYWKELIINIKIMFTEPRIYTPFIGIFMTLCMITCSNIYLSIYLVNQMGSLVFMFLLFEQPISIAAPVCNSLAFMFTAGINIFDILHL